MLTYAGRGLGAALEFEIARLESLCADLRRIADGLGPTAADLASAPWLDEYVQVVRGVPCLVGKQTGHPICKGEHIVTSEVWAIAPALGWARTLSRFYRLGRPRGTADNG